MGRGVEGLGVIQLSKLSLVSVEGSRTISVSLDVNSEPDQFILFWLKQDLHLTFQP